MSHESCLVRHLTVAFTDVLQAMGFVFAEPDDAGGEAKEGDVRLRVGFSGAFSGALMLTAPVAFCHYFAANALGADQVSEIDVRDAGRELLNVTLGQFLSQAFGDDKNVRIGIPEAAPPECPDHRQTETIRVSFDAEGWPLRLDLLLSSLSPTAQP